MLDLDGTALERCFLRERAVAPGLTARATKLTLPELQDALRSLGADVPLPCLQQLYAPVVAENERLSNSPMVESGGLPSGLTFSQLVNVTRARFDRLEPARDSKQAKQYFRGNHLGCRAQAPVCLPSPGASGSGSSGGISGGSGGAGTGASGSFVLPQFVAHPGAKPPIGLLRGTAAGANLLAHDMSAAAHAHEPPELCTLRACAVVRQA